MAVTVRLLFYNVNRAFHRSTIKYIVNSNNDTRESSDNTKDWQVELHDTMKVLPNFISEKEEDILVQEVDPYMKRLRYEYSHWDNVGKMSNVHAFLYLDCFALNCNILNLLRRQYMDTEKPNGGSGVKIAHKFSIEYAG